MKIALLAPSFVEEKVKELNKDKFKDINIDYITYNDYKDVVQLIGPNQQKYDALLFAGYASYSYAKKFIKQEILWDYLPRHVVSFMSALLKASILGYNIDNISCDTFSTECINEAYSELDLDKNFLNISQISDDLLHIDNEHISSEYNNKVTNFHKNNFNKDKKTCIITGLHTVHNSLKKDGIFSFLAYPTSSVIIATINKVYLKYMANKNTNSQLVVLSIEIDLPNQYSIISQNEYFYMKEKMKILDYVYSFAQTIKAAVVEVSYNTYLLFSTKSILETATDNFKHIKLLEDINLYSLHVISMGIGYGSSTQSAKYNASIGMLKSKRHSNSTAYIVYEDNSIKGPYPQSKNDIQDSIQIDKKLYELSESSNIGIGNISMLYNIVIQNNKDCYTTNELVDLSKLSSRTINRMLNKLEDSGLCQVIGKKNINGKGRPCRIIKFNF